MNKLVCPDCRHENEPERIYCHQCGARLDRSGLKKEKVAEEEEEDPQEHLRRMFASGRGRTRAIALQLAKVILAALLCAVVIQMLLPPDLPPEIKDSAFAPMINMDLFSALEGHNPPRLSYSQDQVNSYLAASIRRANSPAQAGFFPIRRIFVRFDEGTCRVDTRQRFFGVPLCCGGIYQVAVNGGKIVATNTGGSLGRMPVHPLLMRGLDFVMHHTWDALARERKDVARLAAIEFHPQSVTLVTVK